MASFEKRGEKWRAIVRLKGRQESKTFSRKADAAAWATALEAEINAGANGDVPDKEFSKLLERYRDEVSPNKDGARWEITRLNRIINTDPIAKVRLPVLRQPHIAAWRDRRLEEVSVASVLREWNLLSAVCSKAVDEFHWLSQHPMKGVTRPEKPDARDRRITPEEIEMILHVTRYDRGTPPCTTTARVGAAFIFAIETAMRAGEICALRWCEVDFKDRVCTVSGTIRGGRKTKAARRQVPLSIEAVRIIEQMPKDTCKDFVFGISQTSTLDTLFRKCRDKTPIEDLHFHDTRHEGITRLSRKLNPLQLAKAVGHANLNELMTYYNEGAKDVVPLLD